SPVVLGVLMLAVGVCTWWAIASSGVHATIAGVLLGLVMAARPADRLRNALDPWVNGIILPLFAFAAAFVVIPAVSPGELSPAFFGIAVALPVGKIIGITLFGWIAMQLRPKGTAAPLEIPDLFAAGALGGIGF